MGDAGSRREQGCWGGELDCKAAGFTMAESRCLRSWIYLLFLALHSRSRSPSPPRHRTHLIELALRLSWIDGAKALSARLGRATPNVGSGVEGPRPHPRQPVCLRPLGSYAIGPHC